MQLGKNVKKRRIKGRKGWRGEREGGREEGEDGGFQSPGGEAAGAQAPRARSLPTWGASRLLGPAGPPTPCKFAGASWGGPLHHHPLSLGRLAVAWRRLLQAQPFSWLHSEWNGLDCEFAHENPFGWAWTPAAPHPTLPLRTLPPRGPQIALAPRN